MENGDKGPELAETVMASVKSHHQLRDMLTYRDKPAARSHSGHSMPSVMQVALGSGGTAGLSGTNLQHRHLRTPSPSGQDEDSSDVDESDIVGELENDRLRNHLLDEICSDMGIHDSMDLDIYDFATCDDDRQPLATSGLVQHPLSALRRPPLQHTAATVTTTRSPAVAVSESSHLEGGGMSSHCLGNVGQRSGYSTAAVSRPAVQPAVVSARASVGKVENAASCAGTPEAPAGRVPSVSVGGAVAMSCARSSPAGPAVSQLSGPAFSRLSGPAFSQSSRSAPAFGHLAPNTAIASTHSLHSTLSGTIAVTAGGEVCVSSYSTSDSLAAIAKLTQSITRDSGNRPSLNAYADAASCIKSDSPFIAAGVDAQDSSRVPSTSSQSAATSVVKKEVETGQNLPPVLCFSPPAVSGECEMPSFSPGDCGAVIKQHAPLMSSHTARTLLPRQRGDCSPYSVPRLHGSGGGAQSCPPPSSSPGNNGGSVGGGRRRGSGSPQQCAYTESSDHSNASNGRRSGVSGDSDSWRGGLNLQPPYVLQQQQSALAIVDYPEDFTMEDMTSLDSTINFSEMPQQPNYYQVPEQGRLSNVAGGEGHVNIAFSMSLSGHSPAALAASNLSHSQQQRGQRQHLVRRPVQGYHASKLGPAAPMASCGRSASQGLAAINGIGGAPYEPGTGGGGGTSQQPLYHSVHCQQQQQFYANAAHTLHSPSAPPPAPSLPTYSRVQHLPLASPFSGSSSEAESASSVAASSCSAAAQSVFRPTSAPYAPQLHSPPAHCLDSKHPGATGYGSGTRGLMQSLVTDKSSSSAFKSHPLWPLLRDLIIADMNFHEPSIPYQLFRDLPSDFNKLLKNYRSRNPVPRSYPVNHSVESVMVDALKLAHHLLIEKIQQKRGADTAATTYASHQQHSCPDTTVASDRGMDQVLQHQHHHHQTRHHHHQQHQQRHEQQLFNSTSVSNGVGEFCDKFESMVQQEMSMVDGSGTQCASTQREGSGTLSLPYNGRLSSFSSSSYDRRSSVGYQPVQSNHHSGLCLSSAGHAFPGNGVPQQELVTHAYPGSGVPQHEPVTSQPLQGYRSYDVIAASPAATRLLPTRASALQPPAEMHPMPDRHHHHSLNMYVNNNTEGLNMYINNNMEGEQLMKTVFVEQQQRHGIEVPSMISSMPDYSTSCGAVSAGHPVCSAEQPHGDAALNTPSSPPSLRHCQILEGYAGVRSSSQDGGSVQQQQLVSVVGTSAAGSQESARKHQSLPKEAVGVMLSWLKEHQDKPYPNDDEKTVLIKQTGLSITQINYWFTNARRRLLPKWRGEDV